MGVATREMRAALFTALSIEPLVEVAAAATAASELVTYCRTFRPDAVIIEADLSGMPTQEVIGAINGALPGAKVFVIGGGPTPAPGCMHVDDVEGLLASLSVDAEFME